MKTAIFKSLLSFGLCVLIIILANQSFWAGKRAGRVNILSHRGVHQVFDMIGVDNETCTASRIFKPSHLFLENTIESVKAAFDYGADAVEIDIIKTRDDEFIVFHDWTLDCRANGSGRTTDHSLTELQSLDIGYGYTYDGLTISTKAEAKACVKGYLLLGWLGYVPEICRTTGLGVPQNRSWLYWGWPNLTLERMERKGVEVGPAGKHLRAIDDWSQLSAIPEHFNGWIVTNKIEVIAPAVHNMHIHKKNKKGGL